jgi:tetratricopeptide (TPR) repeat protein
MAEVPEETAERLMLRARRSKDYQDAIKLQRRAVEIRERELAELDQDSPTLADERKETAHRLSDYWGRLGGIYRRAGQLSDAIDAYRHGMEIEREFRLDDSYNLTNWIVLQLLEDPARLPTLARQIDNACAVVQDQLEGPRRDQWWAWADFGLLCLLGRRPREARAAYEHFQQAGPRRGDYGPVLEVLQSLQEAFKRLEPELAGDLSNAIRYLESASTES